MPEKNKYLTTLFRASDRLMLKVLTGLLVLSLALASWHHTWIEALVIGVPAWAVSAWLVAAHGGERVTRCAIAAALMVFASLQIHQSHGMIEIHFAIFVLLAFLLFYRDWVPLVAAAAVIAVLHLGSDLLQRTGQPVWVFATAGGIGIVLVHAVFVVVETALLVWMSMTMRAEIDALGEDPLKLAAVSRELAQGKLTVDIDTAGCAATSLVCAMEQMRAALDANAKREQAILAEIERSAERDRTQAADNGRVRVALDRIGAAAMLVDVGHTIVYINDFARGVFRAQAGELRSVIAGFDPERLVGASFGVLEALPALRSAAIGNLSDTLITEISAGRARLRVIANPVLDAQGLRLGTVLQWHDRTQEVMAEEEVNNAVSQAIKGNFAIRLREDGKDGFFKILAAGVNGLLVNMADIVRAMRRAADDVRSAADEISRGNLDLSQRTESQASSLEQTASSMEQMTSIVKNNADNADQANQLAAAAREQAERGGAVVGSAVTAMSEINAASRKIADIIGVIDEIAFQTNLLALNAAVEAARAGEQGRGFAVVAAEVRSLASRSAGAAKEIKTLIQDSVGKVDEGTRLVDQTGKALGEIVVGVKKVTDVVAEIAVSSREQASGIEQVNKAVTAMDSSTQQNAALVEESSAAAQALTEQAARLTELISKYQLADASPGAAPPRSARAAHRAA